MNPIVSGRFSKAITKMTKPDALAPIIALEGTVIVGRTYQAYKRGKWDEARERCIEETLGSIVWLSGVGTMNKLGDKIVQKILKSPNTTFDVGTDKILRTPFENFMKKVAPKGFSAKQVALLKGAKVLSSIIITNLFIGFVVPKVNQALTKKLRHKRQNQENLKEIQNTQDKLELSNKKEKAPSFKGARIGAINAFTNAIENTNTGKLLSSDVGIAGGRMYNARRKEERREVAIRDIGSIYFYMWAQNHVRDLLNLIESGHAKRLNPATAEILNQHLLDTIKDRNLSPEDFRKEILGTNIEIPKDIKFETTKVSGFSKIFGSKPLEVIKLKDAEKYITDPKILERAREMSKLQPERVGEAVLTKQQLKDAFNESALNNAKFLDTVFSEYTGGTNKEEYKYISNKKLYNLKTEMEKYVESICKMNKNGSINKNTLNKALKKNLTYNGINFAIGFGVASAFLSTYIPKLQYYVTKKTTGVDAFPGVYDFEHNHEEID